MRINPRLDTAVENLEAVRRQRDRLAMVNPRTTPSFDCASAKLSAEKAICSDKDLAQLDQDIDAAYRAAVARLDRKAADALKRDQRAFIAGRNRLFGRPDYQLRKEMERRLGELRTMR